MPPRFEKAAKGRDLVPEGLVTIAQRSTLGMSDRRKVSPKGRLMPGRAVPSGLWAL